MSSSKMTRFLQRLKRGGRTQTHDELGGERSTTSSESAGRTRSHGSQFGLQLLHGGTTDELATSNGFDLDIVLVHGLNGDARGTWTHSNGTFWPQDLLPARIPGARIFSYGYDSRIFFSTSDADYREFAKGLVRELYNLEYNFHELRSLIFICHSLGGIVVKEAINVAFERDHSRELTARCKGIVFLGTPHQGSGIAGLGALVGNILKVVWTPANFIISGPRSKLISDLERTSNVLFAIADRFVGKAKAIQITSFYEMNKTPPTGKVVVDKSSAVLGLDHERQWPMFLNHHELSRFPDAASGDFKAVVAALREMASNIQAARMDNHSERSFTHSERQCVETLGAVDVIEFEAQIDTRLPETLLWLPKDPSYTDWLSPTSRGILLVTGDAGCGKTVMSSYLSARLPEDCFPSLVCRFYCDAKIQQMSSAVALMKSIIQQAILGSREALRLAVKQAKHDIGLWSSFERLWSLFEYIATTSEAKQIVVLIDAIDEFDEDAQRRIAAHILQLRQSGAATATKFLITGRPHASAVSQLRPHSISLALEGKQSSLAVDIGIFIRSRLKELQAEKGWSDRICRHLVDTLEERADRSFLWASLTLAYIRQRDILEMSDLENALSLAPPDLANFYDRLLQLVSARDSPGPALRLLNMVLSSFRSLRLVELADLLAIDKSHNSIADVRRDSTIQGAQSVQSVLGPLIKTCKSKVQLLHTSLKDHFAEHGAKSGVSQRKGHEILAERCIRYLLICQSHRNSFDTVPSNEFVDSPTIFQAPEDSATSDESYMQGDILRAMFGGSDFSGNTPSAPGSELFDYAARFWASHLRLSYASDDGELFNLAIELYSAVGTTEIEGFHQKCIEAFEEFPSTLEPLSLACFHGHMAITRYLLSLGSASPASMRAAFYWAAAEGNLDCLESLNEQMALEDIPRSDGNSPLGAAAERGHVKIVRFLLAEELCDINAKDHLGRSILLRAAGRSQETVVAFLLGLSPSFNLDVNSQDLQGRTALIWACIAGSRTVVRRLLCDQRTEPEMSDSMQRGALMHACKDGMSEIVIVLMESGVCREGADMSGMTPLIHAVRSGSWKTVKPFFTSPRSRQFAGQTAGLQGLEVSAVDKSGRNAVSWAAETADARILETLLRFAPGQALVPDRDGWLPLAWTMNPPGFPQHASLLLVHSHQKINQRSYRGNSLLTDAICWGSYEIAKILMLHSNINVDSVDQDGRTAVSFAASRGAKELVQILVEERKADWLIKDTFNKSALDWAASEGQTATVEYLQCLNLGAD